jgi:hypothetical protein
LTLPTLLQGCGNWAIRKQAKSRLTSTEIKLTRRTAKYTWQEFKTNEDILTELNINPVVNNIQNYRINSLNVFGEWTEPDCHT